MSDVFVSYAREDRELAGQLARSLSALGWSVWWDRNIVPGQAFDQTIERQLDSAKSVVVLWSTHSVASEWVKNEAAVASERGVLVPVVIGDVKLPLEFRRRQTADLTDWRGDASHSGFQALCEGISATIGGAPVYSTRRQDRQTLPRSQRWVAAAGLTVIVALALGAYLFMSWRDWKPLPVTMEPQSSAPPAIHPGVSSGGGPADLVVGTYTGTVVVDSQGPGRSDVTLIITKQDKWTVRVTSDYARLGTVDVSLSRINNKVMSTGGSNTVLVLDLDARPPRLDYNPRMELAYTGIKQTPDP